MARRVFIGPTAIRVSRPGFDAGDTAAIEQLAFSSDFASLAGSVAGSVYLPKSEHEGNGRYSVVSRTIALPAGSGIPVTFLWNPRADLEWSNVAFNQLRIFYDPSGTQLVIEGRYQHPSYVDYLIYRNRA